MKRRRRRTTKRSRPIWELRLYVADTTPRSVLATGNLQSFCERYLHGQYRLTIIDLVKQPEFARKDEILATPALVRVLPGPQKTVLGTLSDAQRVLQALELDVQGDDLSQLVPGAGVPIGRA